MVKRDYCIPLVPNIQHLCRPIFCPDQFRLVVEKSASGRFVTEQEVSLKCVLAPINKLVNHRLDIIYDFRSEEVLLEYVQEWISFSKSQRLPSAVYSANVHVWKKDACETSRFADWNHKRRVNCFIKPGACLEERRLRDF